MGYENKFYLGSGYDPILQGQAGGEQIQANIEALQEKQRQLAMEKNRLQGQQESGSPIWDSILSEIRGLTDFQREKMFSDIEYQKTQAEIMSAVENEMLAIVRPRIEQSPKGKQMLEAQYKLIMDKKKEVVEESNKEIEMFNSFKIASEANPDLKYAEFVEVYKSQPQ